MNHSRSKHGFTLIELLVVIAIIAILAAILFPVFAQAKSAAKASASLSNQKQHGIAAMLYAGDYDDTLPETGWQGPCHNPDDVNQLTDNYWSGLLSYPLASLPYIKSYQIWRCPSDSDFGGFNKLGSICYEQQLLATKIPGAYEGMRNVPNELRRVFPLSYAGNYFLSRSYATGGVGQPTKAHGGYNLTAIASPSNVFYSADVGSATDPATGNVFAGWYIAPGYGNNATGTGRWPRGKRHNGGRNWTFADGHAKFFRDNSFLRDNGTAKSQAEIMEEYRKRGIYTYIDTDSSN